MTTLERLELLKQDLFNGVEASGRAHQQIINVLKAHIDEVKKEAAAQRIAKTESEGESDTPAIGK